MSIELDKDMAATLTPEELAAIQDAEFSPEELASMKGIAGDDDEGDDDDDDQGAGTQSGQPQEGKAAGGEKAAEGEGGEGAGAEGQGSGEEAAAQGDDDNLTASRGVHYDAALPEDFNDRVTALETREAEIERQFEEGEIEAKEYRTALKEVSNERVQLERMRDRAEIYADLNAQNAKAEWNRTVTNFVKSVKVEGIDYSKDADKAGDLDTFVKRLAENPANADKSGEWFLREAHKRVKALHGIADTAVPAKELTKEDKIKQAKEQRKPPIEAAPKTLAQVPGGDGPGDLGSEFANLDGLGGLELEDAIAKMSPSQRERYLAGA